MYCCLQFQITSVFHIYPVLFWFTKVETGEQHLSLLKNAPDCTESHTTFRIPVTGGSAPQGKGAGVEEEGRRDEGREGLALIELNLIGWISWIRHWVKDWLISGQLQWFVVIFQHLQLLFSSMILIGSVCGCLMHAEAYTVISISRAMSRKETSAISSESRQRGDTV